MKSSIKWAASCLMVLAAGVAHAADPAVKKSSSGICHDSSSPNYKQLKDFTPYKTIDACLKSGGKMPAGVAAPAATKNQTSTKDSKPAPAAKPASASSSAKDTDAKASASTKPAPSKASTSGQIKKSSSGICHAPGTEYYDRTQTFEPFRSMADCIKSGGREPK